MTKQQIKRDEKNLYYEAYDGPSTDNCVVANEYDYDVEGVKNYIKMHSGISISDAVTGFFKEKGDEPSYMLDIKIQLEKELNE